MVDLPRHYCCYIGSEKKDWRLTTGGNETECVHPFFNAVSSVRVKYSRPRLQEKKHDFQICRMTGGKFSSRIKCTAREPYLVE